MKYLGIIDFLLGFINRYISAYKEKTDRLQAQLKEIQNSNAQALLNLSTANQQFEQEKADLLQRQETVKQDLQKLHDELVSLEEEHDRIRKQRNQKLSEIQSLPAADAINLDIGLGPSPDQSPGSGPEDPSTSTH